MTPDELQFDHVETTKPTGCARCGKPLGSTYFQANGAAVCANCRAELEAQLSQDTEGARFRRALVWGIGAAALGTLVYYGFTALTGWSWSLIAIAVGFLVGRAVKAGSANQGGIAFQGLAAFLTYSSIAFSYGLLGARAGIWFHGGLADFIPDVVDVYMTPFRTGARSILGLVIIGIGVYEAWVINKSEPLTITGPYHIGG